jgi:hypothetical protein
MVCLNHDFDKALKFIKKHGDWDEISIGKSFANELALSLLNPSKNPKVPHIFVLKDKHKKGKWSLPLIKERELMVDLAGDKQIHEWAAKGFPLPFPKEPIVLSQSETNKNNYSFYPKTLQDLPDIPSPFTTDSGTDIVIGCRKDGRYYLFPVTVENKGTLNYKKQQYSKGRQLSVDSTDFPILAKTGLHDEAELNRTRTITGKPISEITNIGRPMQYSRAGFMSESEDILSILTKDNRLVKQLESTHLEMAKPLFHVWNIVLQGIKQDIWLYEEMELEYILYNRRKVFIKWQGGRGWQESIFNDEILGQYHLEMWRTLDPSEKEFLNKKYPESTEEEMSEMIQKIAHIHTGEMVPYYIMRYGFYEGQTEFRADPISIAVIFGLKNLQEINLDLREYFLTGGKK